MKPVTVKLYKWAGSWGPFKIKIPCGECTLTKDIIKDVLNNQLSDINTQVIELNWLDHWWQPLLKGGWHAPIVMVNDRLISQGVALNRGVLAQAIIEEHVKTNAITGSHLFGKASCPFCAKAKELLNKHHIEFNYHDVITDESRLYEMIGRVKPIIGEKTPVTVPQIWLDGQYIGGYDALEKHLKETS